MTVDIQSEEAQIIRQLIPLSTLPAHQFEPLCKKITVESADKDTFLFHRKDIDTDLIYLIEGSITLQSGDLKVESIESGTESARFALAHQVPRKIDALSNTSIRFLRLNSELISPVPDNVYKEEKSYMVTDEHEDENDDDWMTTLLKSPIFKALPPANLQKILMSLKEVNFEKGDPIITQGDIGDFYYLIKKGHCLVSRKPSANAKEIKLNQLRTQDTFGEDSLLSGDPRNVSITALTNATLLRLSKENFISLIKEPSLKFIPHDQVQEQVAMGSTLLDVRSPDEYHKNHLPGSISAPFFSLRMMLKTIDKKKPVIIVCQNGKTSEAAAFLLLRNKIDAVIVSGGMEQAPELEAAAFTIDDGVETLNSNTPESDNGIDTENSSESSSSNEDNQQTSLQLENQQLKRTIQKLTAEKNDLETKYRILYKQSEKLKTVLDTFKAGGDGTT